MAYSRLGVSNWYIYYSNESGDEKDDQMLYILGGGVIEESAPSMFSYAELKDCAIENNWNHIPGYKSASDKDKEILVRCVKEFLEDAEEQFPTK